MQRQISCSDISEVEGNRPDFIDFGPSVEIFDETAARETETSEFLQEIVKNVPERGDGLA